MRRRAAYLLFVATALFVAGSIACWFAAIWTHGHDTATRLSGTGFFSMLVASGCFALAAWLHSTGGAP